MAQPRTEVILAPKIDRSDLREVKEHMNAAFDDVATKSRKELEKGTKRGVSDGIRKGGSEGIKHLKRGLAGVAVAVGAVADNALSGADDVLNRMEQRLVGIRDISKEAAAFGVSSGEYAQVASVFTSMGYDQSDVRGLLSGFQAELDAPEMAKFKELADQSGVMQSMLSFIASTADMTQTQRAATLKPLGDEDAVIASALAAKIKATDSDSLQALFEAMTGKTYTAGEITKGIQSGEVESDELARYQGAKLIEDLFKGGDASQIKKGLDLDRRLESEHDKLIESKLIAKEILVTAEIASLEATQATINGLEPWFENANFVLNNLDESIAKTKERGFAGVLDYKPWSTEKDRDKDALLDSLMRGPFWDWLENQKTESGQQDYVNPRY